MRGRATPSGEGAYSAVRDGDGFVVSGSSTAGRGGGAADGPARDRPGATTGLVQVVVPVTATGRHGDPAGGARPRPPLRPRRPRRRAGARVRRPADDPVRSPPTSSSSCSTPWSSSRRRWSGRPAPAFEFTRRVGLRPLLLRAAARLVPGAQAPLRRHEDVARGQPRPGGGPRPRGARRRRRGVRRRPASTKAYLGTYLAELIQDCVQIHGGIGSRPITTCTSTCGGRRRPVALGTPAVHRDGSPRLAHRRGAA